MSRTMRRWWGRGAWDAHMSGRWTGGMTFREKSPHRAGRRCDCRDHRRPVPSATRAIADQVKAKEGE